MPKVSGTLEKRLPAIGLGPLRPCRRRLFQGLRFRVRECHFSDWRNLYVLSLPSMKAYWFDATRSTAMHGNCPRYASGSPGAREVDAAGVSGRVRLTKDVFAAPRSKHSFVKEIRRPCRRRRRRRTARAAHSFFQNCRTASAAN